MRACEIHKTEKEPFAQVNRTSFGKASGRLSLTGLQLYNYLICNCDGYLWTLNYVAYGHWLGWPTESQADKDKLRHYLSRGIKDLENNGFLVKIDPENFEFFDDLS